MSRKNPLSQLEQAREDYLRALERHEAPAIDRMIREYAGIVERMQARLDQDMAKIQSRIDAGETPRPSWIYGSERLQSLLKQARAEFDRWARVSAGYTEGLQSLAVEIASEHVARQLEIAFTTPSGVMGGYDVLPSPALAPLVGTLADGSPLSRLFGEIGPQVRDVMSAALVDGIMRGENPRVIGRRMAKATGVGLSRGIRIARTEMMRTYRTAHFENYRANSDVVAGWMWIATKDDRTCAACMAMHGTTHKLTEELNDHPNGRCTPIPITKTWAQLGINAGWPENSVASMEIETGEDWFAKQPAEVQRVMLGDAGANAYRAGMVKLVDFVEIKGSRVWGDHIQQASLQTALLNAARRR